MKFLSNGVLAVQRDIVSGRTKIQFEVLGNPKALKRHRTFRKGSYVGTYDPSKEAKEDFLVLAHQNAPEKPFLGPVRMIIFGYYKRPKYHYGTGKNSEKLRSTAPTWHVNSPDKSNVVKFVEDALNGIFYRDDSQICYSIEVKRFSNRPRIKVVIEEFTQDEDLWNPLLNFLEFDPQDHV